MKKQNSPFDLLGVHISTRLLTEPDFVKPGLCTRRLEHSGQNRPSHCRSGSCSIGKRPRVSGYARLWSELERKVRRAGQGTQGGSPREEDLALEEATQRQRPEDVAMGF